MKNRRLSHSSFILLFFLVLASTLIGCKGDSPKMILPEVKQGNARNIPASAAPNTNEIANEEKNVQEAFDDLKQFYHTYALNRTDIVLIQNGKFHGYLMIGSTGIPMKSTTAHFNEGTDEDGFATDEVGFLCYNDLPCIDDVKAEKSYPGVYFYFNSKDSCLKFIQKFNALQALL